eukprot:6277719-Amphidinium_carterae.1
MSCAGKKKEVSSAWKIRSPGSYGCCLPCVWLLARMFLLSYLTTAHKKATRPARALARACLGLCKELRGLIGSRVVGDPTVNHLRQLNKSSAVECEGSSG